MSALNCPSCGGSIQGVSSHIRSIDCGYCGAWLRLNNQLWVANDGQKTALNAPSFLHVGLQGSLGNDEHFTVMGRIRLKYERDSWDEWWIEDHYGQGFWVEEDDGVYSRHINSKEIDIDNIFVGVGEELTLSNGLRIFITEKFEAIITGREGFLPTEPETNSVVTYMDGVANGKEYSLEIEGKSAYLTQSEMFDLQSISWDKT